MDRLKRLKSASDFNRSSSSSSQFTDEDSDSSLYYSAIEDTLTDDFNTVNQSNWESPNTEYYDILNQKTMNTSAIGSSTPKAKRLSINSLVAVPSVQRSLFDLQFENNSMAQLLSDSVTEIISIESPMDVDVGNVEVETPVSSITCSSADSLIGNIAYHNNVGPAVERQTSFNQNDVDVATTSSQSISNDGSVLANEISNDNPMVREDSGTSSSLAEGRISKTENIHLALNEISHSNSVLSPLNAMPRLRKTPRRPSGRFVTTKLPSMYVSKTSLLPSLNKRVTLNVNMLMPSGNAGLMKKRTSILKKPSSNNTRASAGPSVTSFVKSAVANVCQICNKSFELKIELIKHKAQHLENEVNNCKYCGHKFQKSIALTTHLKENCPKIPSSERRKLFVTEFKKLSQEIL